MKWRLTELLAQPERKREFNRRLFATVASRYDFITRALSLGRDQAWKRRLIAALPDLARPCCVDMACGTGDLTQLLAQRYPHGTVVGLDLAEPMLKRARHRNAACNIRYTQADMGATGLPSGSADIVTGGYALRNAPELEIALREVHRLLRCGGVGAFLEFCKPPALWAQRWELAVLKLWGGLWGCFIHRDPQTYMYIAESLRCHPDRAAFHSLIERNGFRLTKSKRFMGGVMELVVFQKL